MAVGIAFLYFKVSVISPFRSIPSSIVIMPKMIIMILKNRNNRIISKILTFL